MGRNIQDIRSDYANVEKRRRQFKSTTEKCFGSWESEGGKTLSVFSENLMPWRNETIERR